MDYLCAPYNTTVGANPPRKNGLLFGLNHQPIYEPLYNMQPDIYTTMVEASGTETNVANKATKELPSTLDRSATKEGPVQPIPAKYVTMNYLFTRHKSNKLYLFLFLARSVWLLLW